MSEAKPQDGTTVKGNRPHKNAGSLYVGSRAVACSDADC